MSNLRDGSGEAISAASQEAARLLDHAVTGYAGARRDTREKVAIPLAELADRVTSLLQDIQRNLLARALKFREDNTTEVSTWEAFTTAMAGRPGIVIAPWCGSAECEAGIKAATQATLRNIPLGQPRTAGTCIKCGEPSEVKPWFAKAY